MGYFIMGAFCVLVIMLIFSQKRAVKEGEAIITDLEKENTRLRKQLDDVFSESSDK